MTDKTILTPDVFSESRDSRGVSNVIGTASLIVLALGLVGTMSVGLGGFADGLNTDLDGDIAFQQNGGNVTMTVNSVSDSVTTIKFRSNASNVPGEVSPPTIGKVISAENGGNDGYDQGTTLTVIAADDSGNERVIAQYTLGSVA